MVAVSILAFCFIGTIKDGFLAKFSVAESLKKLRIVRQSGREKLPMRRVIFLDKKITPRHFHFYKHFRIIVVLLLLEDFEGFLTTC